jgi:hypothetical protein
VIQRPERVPREQPPEWCALGAASQIWSESEFPSHATARPNLLAMLQILIDKNKPEERTMDNLEHMERRLSLSVDNHLSVDDRLERLRVEYVKELDATDPALAMKLQNYSKKDLARFLQDVIDHDTGG